MNQADDQVLDNPDTDYERSDVNMPGIGLIAVGTLLLIVIAPTALAFIYRDAVRDVSRALTVSPPAPQLQTHAVADLNEFRAREAARLNSYGWVDRANGVVHIPIAQAMDDVARRGIPDFKATTP